MQLEGPERRRWCLHPSDRAHVCGGWQAAILRLRKSSIVPRSTRKLPYRIAVDFETIKPFVERGRNRTDVPPRKIIEKLGYNISLSADYRNRRKKWVINAMCGAYPQTSGMLNYCKLSLPREADALDGSLQRGTAACLVQAMIFLLGSRLGCRSRTSFRRLHSPNGRRSKVCSQAGLCRLDVLFCRSGRLRCRTTCRYTRKSDWSTARCLSSPKSRSQRIVQNTCLPLALF